MPWEGWDWHVAGAGHRAMVLSTHPLHLQHLPVLSAHPAGARTGTLRQVVVSECVSGLVVSIPLLVITKAHKTADWRLTVCFALCGVSPVRTAMYCTLPLVRTLYCHTGTAHTWLHQLVASHLPCPTCLQQLGFCS